MDGIGVNMSVLPENLPQGQVEVVLARPHVDAFCEWAREMLEVEPVVLERPHQKFVVVNLYLPTETEAELAVRVLPAGIPIEKAQAMVCRTEDWTTFWQHHFHTMDIGRRLRIVPVWDDVPDDGRLNIRVDPGLSFGTGGHFTTRFCLEALEAAFERFKPDSMLDAGCGSGILAIAARKLGIGRVSGFDFDGTCVAQCEENAMLNGVAGEIKFFHADVLKPGWRDGVFDVVCANIFATVLTAAAPALWEATGRCLMVTGIREVEADGVANAFMDCGASERLRDGDGQWCGMVFERMP